MKRTLVYLNKSKTIGWLPRASIIRSLTRPVSFFTPPPCRGTPTATEIQLLPMRLCVRSSCCCQTLHWRWKKMQRVQFLSSLHPQHPPPPQTRNNKVHASCSHGKCNFSCTPDSLWSTFLSQEQRKWFIFSAIFVWPNWTFYSLSWMAFVKVAKKFQS